MKIRTRSRYAVRALLELALHYGEGPLMMQTIAERQGVSRKYLDAIFASLKSSGLVRSRRGAGGGHMLARDPADVRVGDIFRALEGPIALVDCVADSEVCARSHRCVTKGVWTELSHAVHKTLNSFTLADLVREHQALDQGACPVDSLGGAIADPGDCNPEAADPKAADPEAVDPEAVDPENGADDSTAPVVRPSDAED